MNNVYLFKNIKKDDLNEVGYKALNISIIANEGFNVPPGFVITKNAFLNFLKENKLYEKVQKYLGKVDEENISEISPKLMNLIMESDFPSKIQEEIIESYESLGFELNKLKITDLLSIKNSPMVAVRSSYIKEIDEDVSQLTLLNIKGKNNLLEAVKKSWASLFNEDILRYGDNDIDKIANGVIIQKMIDAQVSGISFTFNPLTKNNSEILIKACFGYGIDIDKINPDIYVVKKDDLSVDDIKVNEQEYSITIEHAKNVNVKKPLKEKGKQQKLNNKLISEVARITKRIYEFLEKEQLIEWVLYKDRIFILQTKDLDVKFEEEKMEEEKPIDVYEPSIEEDLEVLNEMESKNIEKDLDKEAKEAEEQRTEEDVKNFVKKVEESSFVVDEPKEEKIPTIDELDEVKKERQAEPKINKDDFASYYDQEEEKVSSFDMIKDLTKKLERQYNEKDEEGFKQTRDELKKTLEGL